METLGQAGPEEALSRYFYRNSDHTLIIDVANDLTKLTVAGPELPYSLKNLVITNSGGCVTTIWDYFLSGNDYLATLDFSGLSKVNSIGYGFLSSCISLTHVEFPALLKLTKIGSNFLEDCISLTTLDMSALPKVTQISSPFLGDCRSLQHLIAPECLRPHLESFDYLKEKIVWVPDHVLEDAPEAAVEA